ncbi:hypothetical protein KIPB_000040, partial [Kipferlia bialata]|eukprot:g40.t1
MADSLNVSIDAAVASFFDAHPSIPAPEGVTPAPLQTQGHQRSAPIDDDMEGEEMDQEIKRA